MDSQFGEKAEITPGKSGQFDVLVNGKLVFSKSSTGRFPVDGEVEEIFAALKEGREPAAGRSKEAGRIRRAHPRQAQELNFDPLLVHVEEFLEAAAIVRPEDRHLENSHALARAHFRLTHGLDVLMHQVALVDVGGFERLVG